MISPVGDALTVTYAAHAVSIGWLVTFLNGCVFVLRYPRQKHGTLPPSHPQPPSQRLLDAIQRARRGFEVKQDQGRRGMIWLWPGEWESRASAEGSGRTGELPAGKTRGTRGRGRMVQRRPCGGTKCSRLAPKAGGGVRDHGGGVGTALLRYLQLNVGKTNFGTFLAYFFHLGSQLLVHVNF